jgi:hypothetical protein
MARPAAMAVFARKGIMLLEKGGQKYKKAVPRNKARKNATPAASCRWITAVS